MNRYGNTLAALGRTLFFVLIGAAWVGAAQAVTKTSAGTGNWGTAGTWSPSGVPAAADDVVIANGHVVTLNVNSNNLRTVTINAGGKLQGDNTNKTLNVTGNTGGNDFTNNGTLDFGPGFLATYFLANNNRLAGGGTWTLSVLNHSTRTLTFAAGSSMTLNISGAAAPFPGTGTITSLSTVTWNFTGSTAQTLSADTGTSYGNVRITNTNDVTLGVALTAARILHDLTVETGGRLSNGGFAITLAAASNFAVQSAAFFDLTGTTTMVAVSGGGTKTFDAASTVTYGGANQAVTAETYGNLVMSGSGTKTPAAGTHTIAGNFIINAGPTYAAATNDPTINITGDATIDGTYAASNVAGRALTIGGNMSVGGTYTGNVAPLNVAGDFTRTGTFTSSTGLVTLNGTAAAAQTVTGATTITNLQINNTGSPGGITLANSVTVGTLLTLTSGVVTTGGNTLITSANCPGSISRTGGHVAGLLQLHVPAGASTCIYHVGDSTTYRPISLTFPASTTTGNLTGSVNAGDHGNIATSQIDAAQNVNQFWTLTNSGVGLGGGNYSATFTFVAGDVDTNAAPLTFEVQRWGGASWSAAETAGTRTATTTQATGITGFSDFAVGQRRLNNFLVGGIPGVTVCNPQALSITARNSSNQTLTNYRGLVNLSTSTNHGDWSQVAVTGTLNNGTADDGAATYQFIAADLGVKSLVLTNSHPETLTVSVNDPAAAITSTSSSYQVDNYAFAITNDTIQVAGRNQAMSVQLNCVTVDTGYTGATPKNLKAWFTLDADDPGGAITTRTIGGINPPSAVPGSNNLSLTFTNGVATFSLVTTDVGKYTLNLSDTNRNYSTASDINGTSSTITTRPFALVVSAIMQGSTNNPGGIATSGSKFIAAADTFQATVGAYLWSTTADTTPADGAPDATATLAQITAVGAAPSYRWTTTLSAANPFTPAAGSLAALSNGVQGGAGCSSPNCFSGGIATPTNLSYPEVGSFALSGSATNFLNSGINYTAIVFDNSATPARNGVIGRFYPDHFTLTVGTFTPTCAGVTYMGQPGLSYTLGIEARNKSNIITSNYGAGYTTGTVSLVAENSNNGTDLGSNVTQPGASWSAGNYSYTTTSATYTRPASPAGSPGGPFDSLQFGVKLTNNNDDTSAIAGVDMNPATTGDCTSGSTCTAKSIGSAIVMRFGRLMIGNASGSAVLPLLVPVEAQYWNGKSFSTNDADTCTTIAASAVNLNVAMSNFTGGLAITVPSPNCKTALGNGGILSKGRRSLQLAAPKVTGNVDLTINLGASPIGTTCLSAGVPPAADTAANLQHLQSGSGFAQNPSARATFGVYRGSEEQVHRQENF